ncbi:MAG: cyclic nucleotide-binding domain-containing protein, partial [Actinomycetota bacterium]
PSFITTVPAGTVVMKEGQVGHTALVLLKGAMVVRRNGRKVREIGPGEVLGEMALIDSQPRSATVACVTDCEVFEIIGGQFRAVLDAVPEIRNHLLAVLAGRVRELDARKYL